MCMTSRDISRFLTVILLVSAASCASDKAQPPRSAEAFEFVVVSDMPYNDADAAFLRDEFIPAAKNGAFPFVIHAGDTKGGGEPCLPEYDEAQRDLINTFAPTPVFYTPGDNEWTDCDRRTNEETGARYSELTQLEQIREMFFSAPFSTAALAWNAQRQTAQPENARWTYDGVMFATLHVVGTNNGRNQVLGDDVDDIAAAADERDAANLAWLEETVEAAKASKTKALIIAMQADMTDPEVAESGFIGVPCDSAYEDDKIRCDGFAALRVAIRNAASSFGKPFLLIHGDTHEYSLGQSFAGYETDNLWRLNGAGDYVRDATLVSVDPNAVQPFTARGLVTGKRPDKN